MSEFEKRSDQADNLRTKMIDDYKELHGDYPPRGEVHKEQEKKTKLKMKYPVISLLALFFILMPIVVFSITVYYGNGGNKTVTDKNSSGNELVYISNGAQSDEELGSETIEEVPMEEVGAINEDENETDETELVDENKQSLDQNGQDNQTNGSKDDTSNKTETPMSSNSKYREVKTHTVAVGETLFSIAIKYYNSRSGEEIIRQYNDLEANDIYVGQKIKIPLK